MRVKMTVVVLAISICGMTASQAQSSARMAQKIPAGTKVEPSKSFDAMLSGFEGEMMGLANAMPADKYDFVPVASAMPAEQNANFTGVRSFGAMVLHVAEANYHYASTLSGLKPDVDMKSLDSMTGKDQIVAALAASFSFTHKAIATLSVQNAFESVQGDQTRASTAGSVVAHGFDHYGQLVEYLRMNGIVPPASVK